MQYRRLAILLALLTAPAALTACPSPGGTPLGLPPVDCVQFPTAPGCVDTTVTDTLASDTTVKKDVATADNGGPDGSCTAQCAGKTCGPDGCGGFCGSCGAGMTCVADACVEGECGQAGATVSGTFAVGLGLEFDKVDVAVAHKMDIDEFEDGCLTTVIIDLGKGFGCTLHVEAGTATSPVGGLRITNLAFSADSQCPGFPDESEGQYEDFSGLTISAVIPTANKVADKNAPESCLTTNFQVRLEGVLKDAGGKTLNVGSTTLNVGGEFKSIGSTTASCPCEASCSGKECGGDGCGFDCGICASSEQCDGAGICQCVPSCDGKFCGDDGCGGSCGPCGEFEACSADQSECVACTPVCSGFECGDNGCGGECGECGTNESCGASQLCECPNTECSAACCAAGEVCDGGDACCAPACNGKQCGDDGCGGSCGTCTGNATCTTATGQCECVADCSGKQCGDDGCGGTCSPGCSGGDTCNTSGQCVGCTPSCGGKQCGADGCGSTCGTCTGGQTCNAGTSQCEGGTGTCDITGFPAVAGTPPTYGTYVSTQLYTTNSPVAGVKFDVMQLDLFPTVAELGTLPVSIDLSAFDNYETCPLCVIIMQGCDIGDADPCGNATFYFPIEGNLAISQYGVVGDNLEYTLVNLVLQEVTIDFTTFKSTPVVGGKTWCVPTPLGVQPTVIVAP